MPITLNGTNGITQADQFNSDSTFGFKNRIINGGFTINQRGYVSGTSLSSGSYGHDRWKGGASNGTYTFTQASAGVNTTITITAGSIIQVIEGANLPEGGTYVLSWTGTAQGKIGAGSFGASGITGTITAGTNTNIEFNTGTCGNVQLEVGSTPTSFDYRPYTTEFALCQRYFQIAPITYGAAINTTTLGTCYDYPVVMRAVPTLALLTSTPYAEIPVTTGYTASGATVAGYSYAGGTGLTVTGFTGFTSGRAPILLDNNQVSVSAEL